MDIFFNIERAMLFHSVVRWAVLVLGILTVLFAVYKLVVQEPFGLMEKRLTFWYSLSADIMLLLGIILWIWGNAGLRLIQTVGMNTIMHQKEQRFFVIEHPLIMLLAIISIHIARIGLKNTNTPDSKKHIRILIWNTISLLLILFGIPWYKL